LTASGLPEGGFEVVIVPGLTERVFPKKLTEDPILPDTARVRLGHNLELQQNRVAAERLALRLATGAARRRVLFSFPRVDLDQGRPRVPSFYALEVLRAAEGHLPGFDELDKRAAGEQAARLGWPAPRDATDAIDDAEFDLAVLNRLAGQDDEATTGAAHYLLDANPHLARALRARARRWLKRWTPADGLVDPGPEVRVALDKHRPDARSYSATALQHFAACPYRFLLYAIHRIQPREEAEAIEVIFDPDETSYRRLLEFFFQIHEPTTLNRQGNDVGPQYRSGIFYHTPEQKAIAEEVIKDLNAQHIWNAPIVTEVTPFKNFFKAEDYHQEYFKLHGEQPYCQFVIAPKVAKFRKKYHDMLKV